MYFVLVLISIISFSQSQTCDNSNDFTLRKDNNVVFRVTELGDILGCQNSTSICSALEDATQSLTLIGGALSISFGNTIFLPDDSNRNELQALVLTGQDLTLTSANTITLPSQTLSLEVNGTLSISNGNAVQLPDDSPLNELQNLDVSARTLSITNGNSVYLPVQSVSLDVNGVLSLSDSNSVTLPDNSPTNELQSLSINAGTVSLSNGNSITLPDSSVTNELQTLSVSSANVSISNGNTIQLPAPTLTLASPQVTLNYAGSTSSITLPDSSATNEIQSLSITGNTVSISGGNSVVVTGYSQQLFLSGPLTALTPSTVATFFTNAFTSLTVTPSTVVVLQGAVTLGTIATGGATSLRIGTCRRQGTGALTMNPDFSDGITFPNGLRTTLHFDGRFTGLAAGTYDFGFCYLMSVSTNNWNSNDFWRMLVTVH